MTRKKMILEIFLSWLIPGSGFIIKKNYHRGIYFFIILNLTFILGVLLKGSVIWPVWNRHAEGFNIINILTFIVQIGNGFFSMISLAASQIDLHTIGMSREKLPGIVKFFAGKESYAYFDIATFFLIVSGSMNYFVTTNFYDQYYKNKKEEE